MTINRNRIQTLEAWEYARRQMSQSDPKKPCEPIPVDDVRYMLASAYDDGAKDALYRNAQCTIHMAEDQSINLTTYEVVIGMLKQHGQCQLIGGRGSTLYDLIGEVLGKLKLRLSVPIGE